MECQGVHRDGGLQTVRKTVNILNKWWSTADKGGTRILGLGKQLTNPHCTKINIT
jgi:hypothetical protein